MSSSRSRRRWPWSSSRPFSTPPGLLALVGWSGAVPSLDAGVWPFAPYLVFVPVLLAVVWWAAVRAGDRFWTLFPGVVLAVLLAQAAACLVMTGDLAVSAWGAGYVTAKAIPAAVIIAALTRWLGGRPERRAAGRRRRSGSPRSCSPLSRRSSPGCGGRASSTRPAFPPPAPTAVACR